MPLAPRAHRGLHRLAHRAAERHPTGELLGHTLRDQLSVDLGVLDLEDVQLDLLAGELLELAADAVGLGATATDHDARTGGVDVHPDPVTGALDLDLGDAGPLHALGQEPADRDVLADVGLVELVGVPAALVVGGDAEAETVRVDLLTHQAFRPFLFDVVDPAWLPGPRRGCTTRVMWLVRLLIRVARPWARGRQRFIVGPSSTIALLTTRVAAVEVLGALGVRDGALEDLVDGLAGGLRRELQQRQGVVDAPGRGPCPRPGAPSSG